MTTTSTSTQHKNGSPKMSLTRKNSKPYIMTRPQSKNSLLKYTTSSGNLRNGSRSRSSSFSSASKLLAMSNNVPLGGSTAPQPQLVRTFIPPARATTKRSGSPSFNVSKSSNSSWTISDDYSPPNSVFKTATIDTPTKDTKEKPSSTPYDTQKMESFLDEVERRLEGPMNGSPAPSKGPCRSVRMNNSYTNSIRSDITIEGGNTLEYQDNFLPSEASNNSKSEEIGDSEEEDVTLCLPVPPFVNRMIRKKRKREKDMFQEAARQMTSEKNSMDILRNEVEHSNGSNIPAERQGILRLLDIGVGDVGLALFIPINWEAFEPLDKNQKDGQITQDMTDHDDDGHESDSVDSENESDSDDDMMVALEDDLDLYPPILTRRQMREISKVLPASVSIMTWNRAYSLSRDGDFFQTMVRKCANFQHTVIVIKTDHGEIIGGYADTPWGPKKGANAIKSSRNFFGGGRAFLYSTNPCLTEYEMAEELRYRNPKDTIFFYRWTGENNYSQICDLDKGTMGMGGGGAFGFFIQEDFTRGSSGSCFTFRNPPLTKTDGGHFNIVDFEVYGFSSMAQSFSSMSMRSRTSSVSSFNNMSSNASVSSVVW